MTRYLIAVGSNINPQRYVPQAIARVKQMFNVRAVSGIYRTAPTPGAGSNYFHNVGILLESDAAPAEVRTELRRIEADLGRVRSDDRNAPRSIDLDIVAVEGMAGEVAEDLVVPDPTLRTEGFVLVPLAEIAPEWEYEPGGATLQELRSQIEEGDIRPVPDHPEPFPARYAPESSMEATAEEVYDAAMEADVRSILTQMGEDPDREGLVRTPLRVAKAFDFLTSGYTQSLAEVVNQAIFESDTEEMVMVRDIEFYSLCEHHMLPFFGKAHVAYLPDQRIIGLSKVARIVDLFSRRLQVQERLTGQVADAIIDVLQPHGAAVVMEGAHFCMMMRGVQKQGSSMVTSAMRGGFKTDARTRAEFLDLIKG